MLQRVVTPLVGVRLHVTRKGRHREVPAKQGGNAKPMYPSPLTG
jgi:hypothetical protein